MFVYIIGAESGPVKIGIATSPFGRIAGLQTGHPERLQVIAKWKHKSAAKIETMVHAVLRDARTQGEWFDVSHDVAIGAVIDALITFGEVEDDADDSGEVGVTFRMPESVRNAMREMALARGVTLRALVLEGLARVGVAVPLDALPDRRATRHKREETP